MSKIRFLLQQFRQDLPDTSETARQIDIRAGLDDIGECAEGEGLHSLIRALAETRDDA